MTVTPDIWADGIFCMWAISRGIDTMDTTLQKEKKKSAFEQIIVAHDCSFLLWINERTASLDSCLLRHKMLAILEGRDHAPEMVLEAPV